MMAGNDYPGTLIALESIDGGGKTSVQTALAERLSGHVPITTTAEPTDMWTGDRVYEALDRDDLDALVDFFMFLADRTKHVSDVVEPALKNGHIVLTDRYADSTRAYQTHRIQEEIDETWSHTVQWVEDVFDSWHIEADIVIYLDISVETAVQRCDMEDKYEKKDNLKRVRSNYNLLYDYDPRLIRVDGEQPLDAVIDETTEKVRRRLASQNE